MDFVVLVSFLLSSQTSHARRNTCAQLTPHTCMHVPQIGSIRGLSAAAECCERCVQNTACKAFTFKQVPGKESVCFLHAEAAPTKPGNCTSGQVHRGPTPSPSPTPSGSKRNILYVIVGKFSRHICTIFSFESIRIYEP